ncbi:MAG TPA: hypothetical protein VK890_05205, partial [Bacteroidia bacterium]|nr:hypothetical protein [Bacteroidia bacterium]
KAMVVFNKTGDEILDVSFDTVGLNDSTLNEYNAHNFNTRQTVYARDARNQIIKTSDHLLRYDAKDNIIADSNWEIGYGWQDLTYDREKSKPNITYTYKKYDSKGNEISTFYVGEDGDTVLGATKYNDSNWVIYSETHDLGEDAFRRGYYTYDIKGNMVSDSSARPMDTLVNRNFYDAQGRDIGWTESENGTVVKVMAKHFNKDTGMRRTEIMDNTPISDGLSCPNNRRNVATYDDDGRILSDITTTEKDGKPFITTYIHRYYVIGNAHIDSCFNTEEGYLHSLMSVDIKVFREDKRENKIEETEEGGGEYTRDSKHTWKFNEQNNVIYSAEFNSCNSETPIETDSTFYYPNGKEVKKTVSERDGERSITNYDKDGKKKEEYNTGGFEAATQTIYEYEK